eukprot:gene4707-8291_t
MSSSYEGYEEKYQTVDEPQEQQYESSYQNSAPDHEYSSDYQPQEPNIMNDLTPNPSNNPSDLSYESIPKQSVSFLELFDPLMKRYVGITLVKYFYFLSIVFLVLSTLAGLFWGIYRAFMMSIFYGVVALLFEPIIAVVSFIVSWIGLRLLTEVILSIFEMRRSLKMK